MDNIRKDLRKDLLENLLEKLKKNLLIFDQYLIEPTIENLNLAERARHGMHGSASMLGYSQVTGLIAYFGKCIRFIGSYGLPTNKVVLSLAVIPSRLQVFVRQLENNFNLTDAEVDVSLSSAQIREITTALSEFALNSLQSKIPTLRSMCLERLPSELEELTHYFDRE